MNDNKLDKDLYKVLSDENFTREHRQKLEGLPSSFDFSGLLERFLGAGSSEVDFSPIRAEIEALRNDVAGKLAKKLNVQPGKVLSSNDFTNEFYAFLSLLKDKMGFFGDGDWESFQNLFSLDFDIKSLIRDFENFQKRVDFEFDKGFMTYLDYVGIPTLIPFAFNLNSDSYPSVSATSSFFHIDNEKYHFHFASETSVGAIPMHKFDQNGKLMLCMENSFGTSQITIMVDGFHFGGSGVVTYQKGTDCNLLFVPSSDFELIKVDGTDLLNGGIGSTATLSIHNNKAYLRISNV